MGDFKYKLSRAVHRAGFQLRKHSPEIFIGFGIVGVVTGAVLACKATTKINAITDEHKEELDAINKGVEEGEVYTEEGAIEYTEKQAKKDTRALYFKTGVRFCKLYAPAALLGTASICLIVQSNNIMRKRNAALAAAYAALDKSYKEYRERVRERVGAEMDDEFQYNIKTKVEEETIVDENGKKKKVKKSINILDADAILDDFHFLFDPSTSTAAKGLDYNEMVLNGLQKSLQFWLLSDGRVFQNDILKELGIDRTQTGQFMGYVYDKDVVGPEFFNYRRVTVDFGEDGVREAYLIEFVNLINAWESM